MPNSKEHYTYPGSDESLYRLIHSSLWSCQGSNLETTMLTEALTTTTQPRAEKKPNSGLIIQLEIVVSLILIGVAVLVGVDLQADVVDTPTDIHHSSRHQGRQW